MKNQLGILTLALTAATSVYADQYNPLTLPTLTDDIRTWSDGSTYAPLYPSSSQTLAGVPFNFQSDSSGNTIFYGGTLGGPQDASLDIPVSLFGVTKAYALINTAFGAPNEYVGSLTFNGDGGSTYVVDLIEGANVRDHYYGAYVNTTADPSTHQAVFGDASPGRAHFDMLELDLPASFGAETLDNIVFFTTSEGVNPDPHGKAFLAGITVLSASVPDAGSSLMLLCGAWTILGLVRRQIQK